MDKKPYAVLFVCTGNICRSPTAEAIFRHRIREKNIAARFSHDSAGTHGYHVGNPPDPRTIAVALARGYTMDDLRARQVDTGDFYAFDLILAMDEGHMSAMRRMAPPDGKAKLAMFLDYAPGCGWKDMPDPYYGGGKGFETVLDLTEQGVEGLLESLREKI